MPANFARLRIAGFKSFADPTVVEILPGLTGVVGPNGCGKSNVIEALRWAMGEANARNMRGAEMEDVIFAGTAGRILPASHHRRFLRPRTLRSAARSNAAPAAPTASTARKPGRGTSKLCSRTWPPAPALPP